ncbi:unnamed protein product, partial [Amoebophrya sp. A25]
TSLFGAATLQPLSDSTSLFGAATLVQPSVTSGGGGVAAPAVPAVSTSPPSTNPETTTQELVCSNRRTLPRTRPLISQGCSEPIITSATTSTSNMLSTAEEETAINSTGATTSTGRTTAGTSTTRGPVPSTSPPSANLGTLARPQVVPPAVKNAPAPFSVAVNKA